jgi:hypothetical protein
VEGDSLLKKSVSTRSAAQENPKTMPKHHRSAVFGPTAEDRREREGVFQQAEVVSEVWMQEAV